MTVQDDVSVKCQTKLEDLLQITRRALLGTFSTREKRNKMPGAYVADQGLAAIQAIGFLCTMSKQICMANRGHSRSTALLKAVTNITMH